MVGRNITRENGISATSQLPLTQPVKNGTSTQSKCLETKKITDYNYFLNQISKRRKPCILREIMHAISKMPTNPISFAVGIPNGKTFPFESMDINLKDGSKFTLEGREMEAALQYLPSVGYLPLIRKMEALQDRIHGAQDWSKQSLMITAGSQEALYNAVEMLISDGDSMIIPSPMFSGTVELLRPHNPRFISVPQDGDGMRPDVLREELQRFEKEGIPLPKVMYTNPTGCNPTGVNLSTSRKKEFYQLACDYNFIILEDDPYYYLHFMKENPQSFLSLDTEGRVLRFDSFSKIMSSGLRLGYVTGPSPLIRNMELHVQISTLHTSALSQVLVNRLIDEWGIDRLLESYTETRDFYREKRDHMIAACEKHLTGLAEWNVPNGGMFLWIRIKGVDDSYKLCVEECVEKNLLIVPGHPFYMNVDNCTYVRLSYSLTNIEEMDKGFACLADVLRQRICNS